MLLTPYAYAMPYVHAAAADAVRYAMIRYCRFTPPAPLYAAAIITPLRLRFTMSFFDI